MVPWTDPPFALPAAQQEPQEAPEQPGQRAAAGHAAVAYVVELGQTKAREVEVARAALVRVRARDQVMDYIREVVQNPEVACCIRALGLGVVGY